MITIPTTLETISTLKDGTIKLVFETGELPPDKVGTIFSYRMHACYLAIKPETFNKQEIELLESLKTLEYEGNKSPSKRMYNTLYMLWKRNQQGYQDFNLYYAMRMEKQLNDLKKEFDQ